MLCPPLQRTFNDDGEAGEIEAEGPDEWLGGGRRGGTSLCFPTQNIHPSIDCSGLPESRYMVRVASRSLRARQLVTGTCHYRIHFHIGLDVRAGGRAHSVDANISDGPIRSGSTCKALISLSLYISTT